MFDAAIGPLVGATVGLADNGVGVPMFDATTCSAAGALVGLADVPVDVLAATGVERASGGELSSPHDSTKSNETNSDSTPISAVWYLTGAGMLRLLSLG